MKNLVKLVGIIALVAIVGVSMAACDGGKSALAGTWFLIEGSGSNIPLKCELLRDGTGFALNQALTWKTEKNRLYIIYPNLAMAFDYKISGSKLNLSSDEGKKFVYVNKLGGESAIVGTWTDIEDDGWVFNSNGELSYENGSKNDIRKYQYIVDDNKLTIHIEGTLQTYDISVSDDGTTAALTGGKDFSNWRVAGPGWSENNLKK